VASAVSGVNMVRLSRAVIPFILVMVACLFLFTYVPGTSMALVHALR
jgi:C4-dicarboxylate transporter DctM subunit